MLMFFFNSLQGLGWNIQEGDYFPIQDPFSSARDIGKGVNKKGLTVMVKAFQIAKTKLFKKNDPAELFVEYPELKKLKQKQNFILSQSSQAYNFGINGEALSFKVYLLLHIFKTILPFMSLTCVGESDVQKVMQEEMMTRIVTSFW